MSRWGPGAEPPCWCDVPVLMERWRCPLHDLYGFHPTPPAEVPDESSGEGSTP